MLKQLLIKIAGNNVKSLYPSPSKMFMLREMKKFLNQHKDFPVALDIAAADLKYRYMFQVKNYIGIDREQSLIDQGKLIYPEQNTMGKAADFFDIAKLPQIADIIVSTHTLAHLPALKRLDAVELLIKSAKPGGRMFFNIPFLHDEDTFKILKENFVQVKQIHYASDFSMSIEKYFDKRTGYTGGPKFIALMLAIIVSWLLSFFEGRLQPKNPAYTLYICKHRILSESSTNDLETLLSKNLPAQ